MTKQPADIAKIVQNPSANYASPQTVVADKRLTAEEKLQALAQWELDARLLAVATEEGMAGGEPSRLDEVKQAQSKLPADIASSPSPTKAG